MLEKLIDKLMDTKAGREFMDMSGAFGMVIVRTEFCERDQKWRARAVPYGEWRAEHKKAPADEGEGQ